VGRGSSVWVVTVLCFNLHPQVQSIQVPNQEFGLSENEPGTNFVYAQFDGIMGLAYPGLSSGGATTALQGMLGEGALSQPLFGVYLGR
jgi:gastricsin